MLDSDVRPIGWYINKQATDDVRNTWFDIRKGNIDYISMINIHEYANDKNRIDFYRSQIGTFAKMNTQIDAITLASGLVKNIDLDKLKIKESAWSHSM